MPDSISPTVSPYGDTLIIDMIRRFSQDRLAPLAAEREKNKQIEPEIIAELGELGVFGDMSQHDFLASSLSAFIVVWLLVVWESVPFVALTLHAGMSQIPREYYEAAALDGANWWLRFRVITLPFLRPVLLIVLVLSVVWDFNVYNQIWVLTQGGPDGGTTTIGIWSFTQAFSSQNYGQGAAIAVLSVVLLMLMTGWWVRHLVQADGVR